MQVDNVRLMTKYGKKKAAVGTLYLTATHLIFIDPDCSKETWVSCCEPLIRNNNREQGKLEF